MATSRPFGVTIVAVLAWITGAIQIATGIFALLGGDLTRALIAFAIGAITVAVSLGIFRGRNGARILLAVVFALNVALAIYGYVALGADLWTTIGSSLLPTIGLILLFTRRANAYFR